jgi:glycosyltransferase involved in cell wall biosynthesis
LIRLYRTADVLYAQLRALPVMATAQPSKVLDYMATGRPVVYGGEGAAAVLVREARAGLVVPPDDAHALVEAVEAFRSAAARTEMGRAGREYVEQRLLCSRTIREFVAAVEYGHRPALGSRSGTPGRRTRPPQAAAPPGA